MNYNQISVIIIPGNHFRETSDNTKAMKKISQLWSKMRVLINQKNKLRPRNAMFFWGIGCWYSTASLDQDKEIFKRFITFNQVRAEILALRQID